MHRAGSDTIVKYIVVMRLVWHYDTWLWFRRCLNLHHITCLTSQLCVPSGKGRIHYPVSLWSFQLHITNIMFQLQWCTENYWETSCTNPTISFLPSRVPLFCLKLLFGTGSKHRAHSHHEFTLGLVSQSLPGSLAGGLIPLAMIGNYCSGCNLYRATYGYSVTVGLSCSTIFLQHVCGTCYPDLLVLNESGGIFPKLSDRKLLETFRRQSINR